MTSPFTVMEKPTNKGTPISMATIEPALSLKEKIEFLIHSSPVFLFMKGTPETPYCGFSANVTSLLNSLNVSYKTFDILSSDEIRQGVKEYANWPTYPQLYINGSFIGGNDIVVELFESGELSTLLKN